MQSPLKKSSSISRKICITISLPFQTQKFLIYQITIFANSISCQNLRSLSLQGFIINNPSSNSLTHRPYCVRQMIFGRSSFLLIFLLGDSQNVGLQKANYKHPFCFVRYTCKSNVFLRKIVLLHALNMLFYLQNTYFYNKIL